MCVWFFPLLLCLATDRARCFNTQYLIHASPDPETRKKTRPLSIAVNVVMNESVSPCPPFGIIDVFICPHQSPSLDDPELGRKWEETTERLDTVRAYSVV